ncbi:XLF-domain-containing protein [Hypoxylon sp. NC1633]|nr:XLF-domain-containing protein [Hypoxylon sp. NC1633]
MALAPKWHPLPAFPDLPALMISPRFSSSSYTFYLTDLANVWVENLDKRAIVYRSLQEKTSIDLYDGDPNQWAVFLSKLNAALDPASPDHHTTSLSVSASASDSTTEGLLVLHVTCVLPQPLQPLKWPVYLTKSPPVGLTSELVLPLIQTQHMRNLEIEDLVTKLKEKDAVITKLVDKLEAMGTGLENVFNSLSGKRKTPRAVVEEKVKGLAVFNESEWRDRTNAGADIPQDVSSLVREVFAESGLHGSVNAEISASSQLNDWWTKIGSRPHTTSKPQVETPKKPQDSPRHDSKTVGETDDDDFQVQATEPQLQSHRPIPGHSNGAEDGTTDDDDSRVENPDGDLTSSQEKSRPRVGALGGKKAGRVDTASQSSRTIPVDEDETPSESDTEPVQPRPQKRPISRLETIGKSKEHTTTPVKPSSPAPLPPQTKGDETASDSDPHDNDSKSSKAVSPPPPPVPIQRRKPEIGRIGGKPRRSATPELAEESKAASPKVESSKEAANPARAPRRKIGMIGKKHSTNGKRRRSESPAKAVEEETEQQKAERRRAELAKDLERKAAVPAKKKRRF